MNKKIKLIGEIGTIFLLSYLVMFITNIIIENLKKQVEIEPVSNTTMINNNIKKEKEQSIIKKVEEKYKTKKKEKTEREVQDKKVKEIFNKICSFQRDIWKYNEKDYFNKLQEQFNNLSIYSKELLNNNKYFLLEEFRNKYKCISYNKLHEKKTKTIFIYYLTDAYKCNKINDYFNLYNNYITNIKCINKIFRNLLKKSDIKYKRETGENVQETIYKFNFLENNE